MNVFDSFEKKISGLSKTKLGKLYEQLEQKYLLAVYLYNDRKDTIEILSSEDNVKNYIKYKNEENKLQAMMNELNYNLKAIEQKLCNHNYIFIYDEVSDIYGTNKLYSCKCLDCEKEMFLNDKEVKHIHVAKTTKESPESLDEYWGIKEQIDNSSYMPLKKKLKK